MTETQGKSTASADPFEPFRTMRDAYLDALPWGDRPARERAFELAMALAPIKTAYEAMEYARALGYRQGTPFATAWALGRALPRWAALAGNR